MWNGFSWIERHRRVLLGAAVLLAALTGLLRIHYVGWMDHPVRLREPVVVELPAGGNLTVFLRALRERGILRHTLPLRIHARLADVADRVRAGEYRLVPGDTPRTILARLVAGDVVQYAVTLVEGMTVRQARERLVAQPRLVVTLGEPLAENPTALGLGPEFPHAEGAFFPDTYNYHAGMSDADILRTAHERLRQILAEEWARRAPGLPYASPYQALIMASLIEKETGLAAERPAIAGVFVRRLQSGMLLQTDPAVIYGLGPAFDGNLTREHLQTAGPYNTYMNPGLPPSPIALAGRASIVAALHPAAGKALYFVARGDGSHEFTDTLDAHNAAVRKYQRTRRAADYRSRPR